MDLGTKLSPGQMPTATAWNNVRSHVANATRATGGSAAQLSPIRFYARNDTGYVILIGQLVEVELLEETNDSGHYAYSNTLYDHGVRLKAVANTGIPGCYHALTKEGIGVGEWGEVIFDGIGAENGATGTGYDNNDGIAFGASSGGGAQYTNSGYRMTSAVPGSFHNYYNALKIDNSTRHTGYYFKMSTDAYNSDFKILSYYSCLYPGMVVHLRRVNGGSSVGSNNQPGTVQASYVYIPNSETIDPTDDDLVYGVISEEVSIKYTGEARYFFVRFEPLKQATREVFGAGSNTVQNSIGQWNLLYVNRALHQLAAGNCASKYEVAYNTVTKQFGRPRLFSTTMTVSNNDGSAETSCCGLTSVPSKFDYELVAGTDLVPELMNNSYVQGRLKLDYSLTDTNPRALVTQCPTGYRPGTIQWFYGAPSTLWRVATREDMPSLPEYTYHSDSADLYIPGLWLDGLDTISTHRNADETDQRSYYFHKLGSIYIKKEADFSLAEIRSNLTNIQSFEQS